MEVYLELTYLCNYIIILVAIEMLGILLNKEMTYLKALQHSFYLSLIILLLYFDQHSWLILIIWLFVFYLLYQKQIFLYYPTFIFIYFSILYFTSSLIPEAFIYNGLLIAPVNISNLMLFTVGLLMILIQVMFIVYLKRKVRINDYLYVMKLNYQQQCYEMQGFLDSGNEVYYNGFPLILIKEGVIKDYQIIDIMQLNDLRSDVIEIIKVNELMINHQVLKDVYVGIIKGIQYDCLLNKALMGGVL